MKVYICADIEGVAGVTSMEQCTPGNPEYERARRLMTAEVNAAIAGAFEGGAHEVVVADSHYRFTNLIAEHLDERAIVIQGRPRPGVMCPGLDASFAGLFFVGHHAGAGRPGVLSHSFSSVLSAVVLNGLDCSEVLLHAAHAGELHVPVGLLTGDDALMAQATPLLPGATTATVKTALSSRAAQSLSPARAQTLIRSKAAEAVGRLKEITPFRLDGELQFELGFAEVTMVDLVAQIPAAQRNSPLGVQFSCRTITEVLGWLMVCLTLAHAVR